MNRLLNLSGEPTKLMLAISAFILVFAPYDIDGSQALAQSNAKAMLAENSSRRGQDEPPLPDEYAQTDLGDTNETQVDTSDDRADDSDSPDSALEDEDDDSMSTKKEAADAPPEDSDEGLDDTREPQLSPLAIKTDTRSLRINIAKTNDETPGDRSDELIAQDFGQTTVPPSDKPFAWTAPDIRYQPLYFEDAPLERYGQTPDGCELRQTVLSAAHFFGSVALLPKKMIDQHRHSCDGPLGFCRPGSDTPFVQQNLIAR